MKDTKKRIKSARNRAAERLDYILKTYLSSGFVKIVGRFGGNTVRYRVYDDGSIHER